MSTSLADLVADPSRALATVERGLQWAEAEQLARWFDVPINHLGKLLHISPATMTRRKTARFDATESDRMLRFVRLWVLACDAVGGPAGARSWLKRPQYGLNGAVPVEMARYETGAREVEALLRRILAGALA
jgi:putative toxin-antitoxin system antitoxin component (TIGR02293 family)